MILKKTKIVLLLGVVLSMLLAACGGSGSTSNNSNGSSNGKTTVTYMTWENTTTNAAIDSAMAKFSDPNITIQRIPSPNSDFGQKITSLTMAKQLPDFFWCGNDTEQDLGSKGVLYDWSQYIQKSSADFDAKNFAPSALKAWYSPDGSKLYGLPTLMNTYGYFYNADALTAAHVAIPTTNWTYDDFFAAAKALTKKDGGKVTQYGAVGGPYGDPFGISNYAVSAGGDSFTDRVVSPTKVTISPEFVQGTQKFVDAIKNGYVTPPNYNGGDTSAAFLAGKVPMLWGGQWFAASFLQSSPSFKWGFVPQPMVKNQSAIYDAVGICSPTYIKNPDAVWKVMTYLDGTAWKDILPGAPVAPAAYVPASSTYFDTLKSKGEDSVSTTVNTILNTSTIVPVRFMAPWATKANDVITANWNDILSGKKPVQPTLDTMAKQINDVIQSNGQ